MKKLFVLMVATMLVMGFAGYASAGEYYMYADFTSADGFLGGYDVDSYGDYLYVNRGNQIDRYTVSTATTSTTDANTHPNNIGPDGTDGTADDNKGPIATRTLTHDTTYAVSDIGNQTWSEIYATADGLYFLDDDDAVSYYQFSDSTTSQVTNPFNQASPNDRWGDLSQLARASDDTWWASGEDNNIYRYDGSSWVHKITHTVSTGGSHLDGLEIAWLDLTDDNVYNPEEFIFAADMTANYIQRYSLDGVWQEQYTYAETGALSVEGMGFGANNHFWATGSGHLYEIGGGAFENIDDTQPVPEPGTILLVGIGLLGIVLGRKSFIKKS